MVPRSYPVCSPGSAIAHPSFVFSFRPLPVSTLFVNQAAGSTSLLSFVSDAAAFPSPPLLRDCGFDPLRPSAEGLTKQWLNEQRPNIGCAQECLLDPAVARALRLRPGASLSPKKFTRQCSSSISGIMENHNTHLAPVFTLNDLVQHQ